MEIEEYALVQTGYRKKPAVAGSGTADFDRIRIFGKTVFPIAFDDLDREIRKSRQKFAHRLFKDRNIDDGGQCDNKAENGIGRCRFGV